MDPETLQDVLIRPDPVWTATFAPQPTLELGDILADLILLAAGLAPDTPGEIAADYLKERGWDRLARFQQGNRR